MGGLSGSVGDGSFDGLIPYGLNRCCAMPGNTGREMRESEGDAGDGEPDEELEAGGGVSCVDVGAGGGGPSSPGGSPECVFGVHGDVGWGELALTHRCAGSGIGSPRFCTYICGAVSSSEWRSAGE